MVHYYTMGKIFLVVLITPEKKNGKLANYP